MRWMFIESIVRSDCPSFVRYICGELPLLYCKTPQHRQKCNEKGELLLNAFVFFHIAEKVLSFSSLSPAFVFCLILLSFLETAE
jgi:Mlc titration factor MtfA (ptsG expression regulator)